jgi:hypothetical protein
MGGGLGRVRGGEAGEGEEGARWGSLRAKLPICMHAYLCVCVCARVCLCVCVHDGLYACVQIPA